MSDDKKRKQAVKLTLMQIKLVRLLTTKGLNGSLSTTELAWRANTSRLAVWSAMRSLEAKKLAGYFRRGSDRWAASHWWIDDSLKSPNGSPASGNEST